MTKEDLQEIRALIREELKPIEDKIDALKEDMDVLKEDSDITRNGVNTLLKWAEKADRSLNVGLYDRD